MLSGHLDEIFYSIQGEGLDQGRPHVFCRLGGCPLRCSYCDTPRSWQQQPEYELHLPNGSLHCVNPVTASTVVEQMHDLLALFKLDPNDVCLSITGGEVLEQPEFSAAIAELWEGEVLLETSGSDEAALMKVVGAVDMVSLDWKLDSLMTKDLFSRHRECLMALKREGAPAQLKVVVAETTTDEEVNEVFEFIEQNKVEVP
ncbi:MAG: 7-carboxy-7-deazaguanine synthase QueE, partial [Planctomycetota bacterium]|nr:7-carboxy-7-deazaguanine synthase QueE [Planctomycetota bacterium]